MNGTLIPSDMRMAIPAENMIILNHSVYKLSYIQKILIGGEILNIE